MNLREAGKRLRVLAIDARAVAREMRERGDLETAVIAGTLTGIARTIEDHADLADKAADQAGEPK